MERETFAVIAYLLRRWLGAVLAFLAVVTASFFLMRIAPGGPFDQERDLPRSVEEALAARFHLDESLPEQYVRYLGGLVGFDLGPSLRHPEWDVAEILADALPVSFTLGVLAMLLALAGGLATGAFAARRAGTVPDRLAMAAAMLGIAAPLFVTGPVALWILALRLGWFPVGGWDQPASAILPAALLALPFLARIARLSRTGLAEVLTEDFIRTARAKGVGEGRVLWVHAARLGVLPVLSYLGPAAAGILTGSVVVETIFSLPGLGRLFLDGTLNRDYTLVLGLVVVSSGLLILFNMVVDVFYSILDPRIRLSAEGNS